jgi:hypothetical protein
MRARRQDAHAHNSLSHTHTLSHTQAHTSHNETTYHTVRASVWVTVGRGRLVGIQKRFDAAQLCARRLWQHKLRGRRGPPLGVHIAHALAPGPCPEVAGTPLFDVERVSPPRQLLPRHRHRSRVVPPSSLLSSRQRARGRWSGWSSATQAPENTKGQKWDEVQGIWKCCTGVSGKRAANSDTSDLNAGVVESWRLQGVTA